MRLGKKTVLNDGRTRFNSLCNSSTLGNNCSKNRLQTVYCLSHLRLTGKINIKKRIIHRVFKTTIVKPFHSTGSMLSLKSVYVLVLQYIIGLGVD